MFGLLVQAKYIYDTIITDMGFDKKIEKQINTVSETLSKKESEKDVIPFSKKVILGVLLANNLVILYTLLKYRL